MQLCLVNGYVRESPSTSNKNVDKTLQTKHDLPRGLVFRKGGVGNNFCTSPFARKEPSVITLWANVNKPTRGLLKAIA